ncbi:hypothetical protein Tco_1434340 [Tanacetum coccineum]
MCRNPQPSLQHSEICPDVGRPVTIDKVIPHAFPTYEIVHQSDAADGVGHQLVERFESTLVRDQAFGTILKSVSSPKVYVTPAGSYVMDRLELRRVTVYLGRNVADILIVIGNFSIPTGMWLIS